jgi:hypothetical protein
MISITFRASAPRLGASPLPSVHNYAADRAYRDRRGDVETNKLEIGMSRRQNDVYVAGRKIIFYWANGRCYWANETVFFDTKTVGEIPTVPF